MNLYESDGCFADGTVQREIIGEVYVSEIRFEDDHGRERTFAIEPIHLFDSSIETLSSNHRRYQRRIGQARLEAVDPIDDTG